MILTWGLKYVKSTYFALGNLDQQAYACRLQSYDMVTLWPMYLLDNYMEPLGELSSNA